MSFTWQELRAWRSDVFDVVRWGGAAVGSSAGSKSLRGAGDRRTLPSVNRANLLGLFVGAGAALSACDIPSATFGATSTETGGSTESAGGSGASTTEGGGGGHTVTHPTTGAGGSVGGSGGGSGGAGGAGGAGGSVTTTSTTTSTTTTTTTTSTWPGPIVPCNYPARETNCAPGEWCCYDLTTPYEDFCSSEACPANYNTLECNTNADCPNKKCCGKDVALFGAPEIKSTYCKASCDPVDDEYRMCEFGNQCEADENCYYVFNGFYTGYGYCDTP